MPNKPTKLYYPTVGYSKSACSAESVKRERIKAPFTLAGNFNGQTEVVSKEQNLKGKILNCFTILSYRFIEIDQVRLFSSKKCIE